MFVRRAPESNPNDRLVRLPAIEDESNSAWLTRAGLSEGIILIGGTSIVDFRIRVAQSKARGDLHPSYWSMVGLLEGGKTVTTVPLDFEDNAVIPGSNGIRSQPLSAYDDPSRFPNIAVIQFTTSVEPLIKGAEELRLQRSVVDLPELMVSWLGFLWGVPRAGNPLDAGHGLPSAVFTHTVCGLTGVELSPGLSSASSCPEVVWQAAKWWQSFYDQVAVRSANGEVEPIIPQGQYTTRQPSAAVHDDEPVQAKSSRRAGRRDRALT